MNYEELKSEVKKVLNNKNALCDGDIITASDLLLYMNESLLDIYEMLDNEKFVSDINKNNGYTGGVFKRIKTYKNHPVPFVKKITYSTDKESNGNIISVLFSDSITDFEYVFNIFKMNELESFEYGIQNIDEVSKHVDIDFIKNYIIQFIAENYQAFIKNFKLMEDFDGVIKESKIDFDLSNQSVNSDAFTILFDSTDIYKGVCAELYFADEEKEKIANRLWLSRQSIKSYMNQNKELLLDKLQINIEDLNDFYKNNVRKSMDEEFQLKKY